MNLILLIIYGIFVGLVAKVLHPGPKPVGLLSTICVGVGGTFLGGFMSSLLGIGSLSSLGTFVMAVIGGIVLLVIYRYYVLSHDQRSFWTGDFIGK